MHVIANLVYALTNLEKLYPKITTENKIKIVYTSIQNLKILKRYMNRFWTVPKRELARLDV